MSADVPGPEGDIRTVRETRHLQNSASGKPRFRVTFTDGTVLDTKPDAALNYGVSNPEFRVPCRVIVEDGLLVHLVPMERP